MQIIQDYKDCPASAQESVIALGNFDGVHLGHQAVIKEAITIATESNKPSAIMTFEPHPLTVLKPDIEPLSINTPSQKTRALEELGIDILFTLPFTQEFSQTTAQEFIEEILINHLKISHIVIGYDFIFGHNRGGNAELLKKAAKQHDFGFTQVTPVQKDEEIFSSTLIRNHLKEGNIKEANTLLGHPYEIEGIVQEGQKRGAELGYPTANLHLDKTLLRPKYGIYIVSVQLENADSWLPAVASFGINPTFEEKKEVLEIHIFNFQEELYGQRIHIKFLDFLRPEATFDSTEALKAQIEHDCNQAQDYFAHA